MDCQIESIHEDFASLQMTLEELILDNNPLSHLPNFITNFGNLRTLSVVNTYVTILPEDIGQTKNLRHLNLMYTSLVELPNSFAELHVSINKHQFHITKKVSL